MCTHQKFVTNRYTHTTFLSKCGHCPACLQEKAYRRSSRIKNEYSPDKIVLFVTLTYDRSSCPFVEQSDIDARPDVLPIYREHTSRRVRFDTLSGRRYLDKRNYGKVKIGEIEYPDYSSLDRRSRIAHLKFRSRYVGICFFPDVQLFKKRLNINLKRIYKYYESYKVYSAMEYGETTSRPHAHLLFHIRPCDEALFRTAICEAWPFASKHRTARYIEIARDAANYVASYVNSGTDIHPFLSINCKAKHSYSKDYGVSHKLFSLDSILSKVSRGDLSYIRAIGRPGSEQYVNFSIPKYVINRYFPLFKGYSRLTESQVLDVLRGFIMCPGNTDKVDLRTIDNWKTFLYTDDDYHAVTVRLSNAFDKYRRLRGYPDDVYPLDEYLQNYVDTWRVYKNTNLKLWYLDDTVLPRYRYDNIADYYDYKYRFGESVVQYIDSSPGEPFDNPNMFPQNVNQTYLYEQIYNFRLKEKKSNNYVMAQNNYYF